MGRVGDGMSSIMRRVLVIEVIDMRIVNPHWVRAEHNLSSTLNKRMGRSSRVAVSIYTLSQARSVI